jgi:hypothetical protein
MEDARYLIENAYVEKVDVDKVIDGAMRGLVEGLDPSSAYLTPDEGPRRWRRRAALPAGDVGIVGTRQFYLRVVGVRDGSPAAKAGLQTGDFVRRSTTSRPATCPPTPDSACCAARRAPRSTLLIIRGNAADPHPNPRSPASRCHRPRQHAHVAERPDRSSGSAASVTAPSRR